MASTRRRRLAFLVVAAMALIVGPLLAMGIVGGRPPEPLDLGATSLRVIYRVTDSSGEFRRDLTLDRPFRSEIVDAASGDRAVVRIVSRLGLRAERLGDAPVVLTGGLFITPLGEFRRARELSDDDDAAVPLDRSSIRGFDCEYARVSVDVFRDDRIRPVGDGTSYTEVCAHTSGTVLAWRRVEEGATVEVGELQDVVVLDSVPDRNFTFDESTPVIDSEGSLVVTVERPVDLFGRGRFGSDWTDPIFLYLDEPNADPGRRIVAELWQRQGRLAWFVSGDLELLAEMGSDIAASTANTWVRTSTLPEAPEAGEVLLGTDTGRSGLRALGTQLGLRPEPPTP